MIYLLLIILFIYLIICYYTFNKNLFSPAAILCEVYILSTISCIYNIETWQVNMHLNTFFVIVLGNLIFISIAIIIHKYYNKREDKNEYIIKKANKSDLEYINISKFKYIIILLIFIIISILLINENLKDAANISSVEDFSKEMIAHRYMMVHGENENSSIISALGFFLNIGVYMLVYIFINNLLVNKKKKSNYLLILPIMIHLVATITSAQRTTILLTFIYTLFILYVLLNKKYNCRTKINIRFVKTAVIAIIIFFLLFGATRMLFGRIDDNTSIMENVTYYAGNSIEALDAFLQNPIEPLEFGEELFRGFRVRLSKYGILNEPIKASANLEFRYNSSGVLVGNVYTSYRKYIHDFGYVGILIFTIISSLFYSIWYEKINKRKLKKGIDLNFLFYAWFVAENLFRHSIQETFFSNALSDFPRCFICGIIWYLFIMKFGLKYNDKKIF